MSAAWRNRTIGLVLAGLIYWLDQWLKYWILGTLDLRAQPGQQIELLPFFNLTFTRNIGVSFGMFEAASIEARAILIAITTGIALVVLVWLLREKLLGEILGLALILGGAAGNITDRAIQGYVIDYADLHIGEFRPFLIFNLADAAISIGVVIILARALFLRDKGANTEPAASDAASDETTAEKPAEI